MPKTPPARPLLCLCEGAEKDPEKQSRHLCFVRHTMAREALVTVSSVANPVEAEVIRNGLSAEGIECFLEGAQQAGVIGTMAFPIKIQVPAKEAGRAEKYIREHQKLAV